jgi:dienelactone hydrolase
VFGRLPTIEDVALSPSGERIAFVKTQADDRLLGVKRLGDAQTLGALRVGDTKLRDIGWLDEDNLLLTYSNTAFPPMGFIGAMQEWEFMAIYNLTKRKLSPVSFETRDVRAFNSVIGMPMIREIGGKTRLFAPGLYVGDKVLPALFEVGITGNGARILARSGEQQTSWIVDATGAIAATLVYHDSEHQWALSVRRNGRDGIVASGPANIDIPDIVGFSADGAALIVRYPEPGGSVWRPVDLQSGAVGAPLGRGETFASAIEERTSDRIIGGVHGIDETHYVFFDPKRQARWDAIANAYGGERVRLVSHSDDFSKIIVEVFGARHGFGYQLIDWESVHARPIGDVYADLPAVAAVQSIEYAAADGMAIQAYLTLPPGLAARGLPLVVMPHGGPAVAETRGFDWWAQALASRGYAVLQPNYRGSAVTSALLTAGFGEWGRKMQTDLSDGVAFLARQGTIDPKRVCIAGASYGGYAALAGVTLQTGVYRCAVSVAGIGDLKSFLRWVNDAEQRDDNVSQRYWDRFLAVAGPRDPALHAISPIDHVASVDVPVLLIHGRDDTVVPYAQSAEMADALKHAGKRVEFVTLKREDHWLSRTATRQQMLDAVVAFLETHNPPGVDTPGVDTPGVAAPGVAAPGVAAPL